MKFYFPVRLRIGFGFRHGRAGELSARELHLFVETSEEQLKELKIYSPLRDLDWKKDFCSRLYDDFEKHISHGETLESFARKILEYY